MNTAINYYVAARNPYRGGLGILETNHEFPYEYQERISNENLELISDNSGTLPVAVFPIDYNEVSISMALKIKGSKVEKRPHEAIHGITADGKELKEFCQHTLGEDWVDDYFFPVKGEWLEELGEWRPDATAKRGDRLEKFWKSMDETQVLGFFWAVMDVIKSRRKVQLIVPPGSERIVQAACYAILPKSQICNLSTISCGECTESDADILITKKIEYQDARKYRLMTLSEFINSGNLICDKNESKTRMKSVEDAVEKCLSYISDSDISDYELSEIRRSMRTKSTEDYREFQGKLKCGLEKYETQKWMVKRYVKVLHLAYEIPAGSNLGGDRITLSAPYDMEGITSFLCGYCKSKRYFRRFIAEVIRLQNEHFEVYVPKKEIEKSNNHAVKKIAKFFKN